VIGLFVAVGNTGGLAAAAPLAMLLAWTGWRGSFVLVVVLTAVVALLCWLLVRDDPRDAGLPTLAQIDGHPGTGDGAMTSLWAGLGLVLRNRNLWLLGIYAFLSLGSLAAMQGLWTVPYLRDVYRLPAQEASNMLTMWAVGLTIGGPLWGYLADRVFKNRRGVVLGGLLLYILPWIILVLWPADLPPWSFYGLFLWAGATNGSWVPVYGQLKSTVPPAVAASALGILNFFFFTGGAVYQTITGLLMAAYGQVDGAFPVQAYQAMFALCLAGLLVGAVAVFFSREGAWR
jgi:sugar phosphate permease